MPLMVARVRAETFHANRRSPADSRSLEIDLQIACLIDESLHHFDNRASGTAGIASPASA
jgi:hypothetical protein